MTIEILLATYNGEKYLQELLNSLLSQSYVDWKVTVCDDNSEDSTLDILFRFRNEHPERVNIVNTNGGFGATRNFEFLLSIATEPYIMLCDQDDVWNEDKVAISIHRLLEMEATFGVNSPLLVFTDVSVVDEYLNIVNPSFWEMQKFNPFTCADLLHLIAQNIVMGCTIIMNQAANRISIPIPSHLFQHDHWIAIQVANVGHISFISKSSMRYRLHKDNAVGARRLSTSYFVHRLRFFPVLWKGWKFLRRSGIQFSIWEIIWLKIRINLKRLFW